MKLRVVTVFILGLLPAWAADKKPAVARAENDQVGITATLYDGKEAVRQQLGSDLGGYFTIIQVAISPKAGKALAINKDDFLLRSDKDGQRCRPFAPSQIAGRAALVVSETGGRGGVMGENPGPVWGGIPGTGGRPQRMGGDAATMGNTAESSTQATIDTGAKQKEDPVLTVLKQKALPEKETVEPVAGLVYFSLEGKHKPKDLELVYDGPAGKLSMRFRP